MNSQDHLVAADLTKAPSLKAYQLAPTLRTENPRGTHNVTKDE